MKAVFFFAGTLLAFGCGRHHARPARAVVDPALDVRADRQAQVASASRGANRLGEVLHGTVYEDESVEFKLELSADRCYWIGGASSGGTEKLALFLFDPRGKRAIYQKSRTTEALLDFCPSMDGIYRLETKLGESGHLAVAVYAGARPAAAPKAEVAKEPSLEETIAKEAAATAPGTKQVGSFFDGSADETSWPFALERGRCYWFVGAGQPGKVKKLSLYLWDPANKRVTENRAETNTVSMGHCARESGMFKFQAKVGSGEGHYKVAVFEKL